MKRFISFLLVLTLTKLREAIVDIIPNTIKKSLTIGIGLFIAFVGLQNAGIIIKNDSTLVTFGSITQGSGLLTIIGLIITALFVVKNIKGGMLWAILITTIIGIPMGLTKYQGLISLPHSPASTHMHLHGHCEYGLSLEPDMQSEWNLPESECEDTHRRQLFC